MRLIGQWEQIDVHHAVIFKRAPGWEGAPTWEAPPPASSQYTPPSKGS